MRVTELLAKNRSFRRYEEAVPIPMPLLREWVDGTRFTPSAANLQPLRYIIVGGRTKCTELFPSLRWAAYLKDWPGPGEGERPSAYIVMACEGKPGPYTAMDVGIALQSILLCAVESGFGGCAIASFDRVAVRSALLVPENLELMLVVALGKPKEKVVIEEIKAGDVKYWRDRDQVHHVPKRSLAEILVKVFE